MAGFGVFERRVAHRRGLVIYPIDRLRELTEEGAIGGDPGRGAGQNGSRGHHTISVNALPMIPALG